MSGAVVITTELDHLDQLGAKAFAGFLVRKDLVRKYSRQYPVPPTCWSFCWAAIAPAPIPPKSKKAFKLSKSSSRGARCAAR